MTDADAPRVATRPRVLLIENKPAQLQLYAMLLAEELQVSTATRGDTGYSLACTELPDAIVVDVLLPDTDGLEVCANLLMTPETAAIPLIVLTSDDAAYFRALAMASLAAVLKMPCPIVELLSVIRRVARPRKRPC